MLGSSAHWAYQPLSAEHVRWYWLKPNFDAKTAVKSVQPDVPHRADILRFCDADNATLEAGYQCVSRLPRLQPTCRAFDVQPTTMCPFDQGVCLLPVWHTWRVLLGLHRNR